MSLNLKSYKYTLSGITIGLLTLLLIYVFRVNADGGTVARGTVGIQSLAASSSPAEVTFSTDKGIDTPPFYLKKAVSPEERAKGLMFVKSLESNSGMLFVSERSINQVFWMKDTYVSLDLLFVDESWKVVGIIEKAQILSEKPLSVDRLSKYVIELPAGTSSQHGIVVGSVVKSR